MHLLGEVRFLGGGAACGRGAFSGGVQLVGEVPSVVVRVHRVQ